MEFDAALAVVLGWVGHDVSVAITDTSSSGPIAHFRGRLGPARELHGEAATEYESVALPVGSEGTTLILDRPSFHCATGDMGGLALTFGRVTVMAGPHVAPPAEPVEDGHADE